MLEIKKRFSRRELQWFGPLFALFFALIGWLVRHHTNAPVSLFYVLATLVGIVIVIYYAVPRWQALIYRSWLLAVAPIGWLVAHLLLTLLYYLMITPIGLLMRLLRHDPLQRWSNAPANAPLTGSGDTYWVRRTSDHRRDRYFRQF